MSEPVLQVRDLVRSFGPHKAVDGVSFSIGSGQTYGLLGPNGAGKTTTISIIAGLLSPDSGSVSVLGAPLTGNRKSLIGLVPQDIALYPDLSALENLQFFGRLQNLSGSGLKARMAEVLEVVGLADRAKDRIETYSGGMKRRANIAVGLLHEPRLLILDEPTVGVDPQSRNSILEAVEQLGGAGMAVLYTTHYMEEAERLCDRIGIIDSGRLMVEGTRDELIEHLGEQTTVTLRFAAGRDLVARWSQTLRALPGVSAVQEEGGSVQIVAGDGPGLIAPAVQSAQAFGVEVTGVDVSEPDLEAVFLHLTGKALRD
jgi:ABC-2 type transport system ATP-binding protein